MVRGCGSLTTIYALHDLDISAGTSIGDMFGGCTSLKGGAGTTFNASYVSANYAIIDTAGG